MLVLIQGILILSAVCCFLPPLGPVGQQPPLSNHSR